MEGKENRLQVFKLWAYFDDKAKKMLRGILSGNEELLLPYNIHQFLTVEAKMQTEEDELGTRKGISILTGDRGRSEKPFSNLISL